MTAAQRPVRGSSRRRGDYPPANDPAVAEMVDDPQAYFKKVREGKR